MAKKKKNKGGNKGGQGGNKGPASPAPAPAPTKEPVPEPAPEPVAEAAPALVPVPPSESATTRATAEAPPQEAPAQETPPVAVPDEEIAATPAPPSESPAAQAPASAPADEPVPENDAEVLSSPEKVTPPPAEPQTPVHRIPSPPKARAQAVDLVTGKAKVEYFFDPTQVLESRNTSTTTPFKTPSKRNIGVDDSSDSALYSSKHLYVPCTIVKSLDEANEKGGDGKVNGHEISGPALVKTSDGTLYKVREVKELTALTAPDDYEGMSDILHLANISEASLLHTLRIRYKRDDIYTSAGPILISINPYKSIHVNGESLYSHETMMKYRQTESFAEHQNPHLFQVADRAYSAMIDSVHNVPHLEEDDAEIVLEGDIGVAPGQPRNQSIIISGESGAGKTEATKFIMQYLARITKKNNKASDELGTAKEGKTVAALEDRVLSSNPLLETFGNAQTLRNDNSSRFGKFIHINFSTETGAIVGARISNYLLEKTRITHQIEGERNYHIFYQLFAGAMPELLEELGLEGGTQSFKYLGNRPSPKTRKDLENFKETVACLSQIGLGTDDQNTVFALAAAVLHLGNVSFEESKSGDHAAVITEGSRASLQKACSLLGLEEKDVTEAILTKLLTIGGKTIKKPSSVAVAEDKRDALAKMTYSCIFLWLVESINRMLATGKQAESHEEKNGFIGVLDIYGFETFEVNGYEQLLINYCNEKLQRHFNRHLFEVEQSLYSTEGVDWTYITFNDNRPCLELIEGGSGKGGILTTLDDAYAGMGNACEKDVKFVSQLHKLFGSVSGTKKLEGHEYFITPKFGNDRQFIIVHYAGEVKYSADGFVEKNMESLSNELKELGDSSSVDLAKAMYSHATSGADSSQQSSSRRSSIRGFSVAAQFKLSLQSLVEDLEKTQPHYIRCIKPNLKKSPNNFNAGEILKQLRYSGMMEAIRIRREGYALREPHQSFFGRFSVLLGPEDLDKGAGIEQLVKVLSKRLNVTDADWQIGHSKIFLRRELSDKLERLAKLRVHAASRCLGKFGKKVVERRLSSLLVSWVRFRLKMLKKMRRHRAVSRIQALFRKNKHAQSFALTRTKIILIQSIQRKKMSQRRVRKIRDPFCDHTYKDIKEMLRAKKLAMERAVKAQDFKSAAEMEAKIEHIASVMESKKPMTRTRLETLISKVQVRLEEALQQKAYTDAGPLQDELEALVKQRQDLPTMTEHKNAVRTAELDVASAAKNRDFALAAASQAELDAARKRLEMALEAEESDDEMNTPLEADDLQPAVSIEGFECRADVEVEILSLQKKVEEAISKKDFKAASDIQATIEHREKLRSFFPSLEELESEIKKKKEKMDNAVGKREFILAGRLNEEIERLQYQVETEREKVGASKQSKESSGGVSIALLDGEEKHFDSRFTLEEEIKATKSVQSEAVAKRQFKRAEACQRLIEDMEKMRAKLPTVAEMGKTIMQKKSQMHKAIAEKRFGDAENLDQEISVLEQKLSEEKRRTPDSVSRPTMIETEASALLPRGEAPARNTITPRAVIVPTAPSTESGKSPTAVPRDDSGSAMLASISAANGPVTVGANAAKKSRTGKKESSVSKLRPKRPITASVNVTVLDVCKMLADKRGDAAILMDDNGAIAGIITDTDVTRRVVSKDLDPSTVPVHEVMTANPTCVSMADAAGDAMAMMIESRFRHLPVVDGDQGVVGVLDIAKCLNDAISKIEKVEDNNENINADALLGAMQVQGDQAAKLQALLGPLLKQVSDSRSLPTLRSILKDSPSTIVEPTTSVLEASVLMTGSRKAALIVESGKLVGIFGFKDMMTRVVAKELPLDITEVSTVMTSSPESVSPDMTVLEALQFLHDHHFLTLPVCEDDGTVVGLVDVMDVIHGCGGSEGWQAVFGNSLELDDLSDSGSHQGIQPLKSFDTMSSRKTSEMAPALDTRPVSKLRPGKPLVSSRNDSVLSVVQMLTSKRGDAALLVSEAGALAGIITDTDVTRRLVAKHLDASSTIVANIMTKNPTCVSMTDPAMDAMSTMVENHFRHLPVVDENGGVVGLLDIAKCLNDAISKLERSQSKTKNSAGEALMQAVSAQGGKGDQAAALQALLGPLMAQALGSQSSPTLRSLLAGVPGTIVAPGASVLDAGMLMAERRKATLVVDDGRLVGIFGFKDMMTRVVAKELQMELTEVSTVMTPNPESVSPDMTVLEALQMMHDFKFLTLPVCEEDGTVVGLVDVMDVIYGCGGVEGWRSVFNSTLDLDDASENASVHSGRGSTSGSIAKSLRSRKSKSESLKDMRPVSKLRPKKPLVASTNDSVLSVTKMLTSKRGDAALLVSEAGALAGIITDTDVTRRLVAKHLDASSTIVANIMTKNPTCVSMTDPAMDAMSTMVENHFRHLPVVDENGGVVGLLDIAKCLNDAISKLERSQSKTKNSAGEALMQAVSAQGGKGDQAAALQALLGPLMAQALGSQSSPTLRSLLAGVPGTIVAPGASVLDAGMLMAERRKATLVVDDGRLVGIFGFKDMMTRVVAKELQMELTEVSTVMTPNPESVSPDMTVLEALQMMHDFKFLTLPVCEEDGTVVGLVDVMDVIYGCGGVEGWRSVFNSTLDLDDASDTASAHSGRRSTARSEGKSTVRSMQPKKDTRSVSMLRPKKPLISSDEETILSVAQMLSSKRGTAAIIVNNAGGLSGIVTDSDFTRRVVTKFIDPSVQKIKEVMTLNPKFVSASDSAIDATMMMIQNNIRHLPVSDDSGAVIGVLDIAKCLNDAISKLENAASKSSAAAEHLIKQALEDAGQAGAALKTLLGPLVSKAFGNQSSRSLGTLLSGAPSTIVEPETSVLEAATLMAESRKAALIAEEGKLVGIFGFKDLMSRVIAKELDPEYTLIGEVMTPNPEVVSPDMTILEALQMMHDHHFLTLPVCKDDGTIVGVVNVMDVIHGCGGVDGWRDVFDSALEIEDDGSASAAQSALRPKSHASKSIPATARNPVITVSKDAPMATPSKIPGNIPTTLEFREGHDFDEGAMSLNDTFLSELHTVTFKVVDLSGHTHRLKSDTKIASLQKAFADKVGMQNKTTSLRFKFVDEEGDAIMVTSDDDLAEAVKIARASFSASKGGFPVVKLTAVEVEEKGLDPMLLAGVGAAVAAAGIAAMMIMLRPRRTYY